MSARERLISGQAWDDFCDQLKQAGHVIDAFGAQPDDLDRAEWYRFLTRSMRSFFVKYLENSEPTRPRVIDGAQWRQHLFFSSPDQDHLVCEFPEAGHSYRLFGTRGNCDHFVIACWEIDRPENPGNRDWAPLGVAGLKDFNPAMARSSSFIMENRIDFDAEGRFEIIISPKKPGSDRNWLELKPDCAGLLIRMLFRTRDHEVPADIHIERLDRPEHRPVTPAQIASGLAMSAQHLLAYAEDVRACWFDKWGRNRNAIVFDQSVYLTNGGVADRQLGFGSWECAADEAVVIEFTPPDCDYWNFHLSTIWQESLDTIEDGGSTVQKYNAVYEADGSVCLILAARDPGLGGNWLDTFGHRHGTLCLRYVMTREAPPPITIRTLKLG